jgi:hypothetical protein
MPGTRGAVVNCLTDGTSGRESGRRLRLPQIEVLTALADANLLAGGRVALDQTVAGHFVYFFAFGAVFRVP